MTAHAPELPDLSGLKPTARHLAELAAELRGRYRRCVERRRTA